MPAHMDVISPHPTPSPPHPMHSVASSSTRHHQRSVPSVCQPTWTLLAPTPPRPHPTPCTPWQLISVASSTRHHQRSVPSVRQPTWTLLPPPHPMHSVANHPSTPQFPPGERQRCWQLLPHFLELTNSHPKQARYVRNCVDETRPGTY